MCDPTMNSARVEVAIRAGHEVAGATDPLVVVQIVRAALAAADAAGEDRPECVCTWTELATTGHIPRCPAGGVESSREDRRILKRDDGEPLTEAQAKLAADLEGVVQTNVQRAYDAGYEAAEARVVELEAALRQAREAIREYQADVGEIPLEAADHALDAIADVVYAALAAAGEPVAQEMKCDLCGHQWRRHDPEDGECDAHTTEPGEFGPCGCGRDLAWMQHRIADLSRFALHPGSRLPEQEETR